MRRRVCVLGLGLQTPDWVELRDDPRNNSGGGGGDSVLYDEVCVSPSRVR